EERIHIGREIHDELGQALTGLKFDIATLARSFATSTPEEVGEETKGVLVQIDRIINSVRRIASGLRPEVLDEIGLSAAIEWQARGVPRPPRLRCLGGRAP